ncbi:T9SS type A sorting domain-containing protein [Dyadobacter sp. CY356]|uniref:T9SS type A sorting domain-containing protein n=1 Tax=Dyadobacter sp. CY356 TaxID=2906442 RepID=UPI001F320820|nr:T9SS type A sorting domain-containing protein [Dyadobacter sp. CY356]MCF0054850.1 T9SS type A sorting domain-containing protein [Dyadobacter sp. CY356]
MRTKILSVLIFVLASFSAMAQDPAVAGINPDKSPIMVNEVTTIQADVLNGSSAAILQSNNATWTINLPPNVEAQNVTFDDPAALAFLSVYMSPYDPVSGTTIQIVSDKGNFPGQGAYIAYISVIGRIVTTPGFPAPMSINAGSLPPVGTNNSGNDNASSSIVVIAALNPPVATDDNAGTTSVPIAITVLTNDTPGSAPIDPTKVMLIDPATNSPSTNVTIPGEGNYTVNTTTGVVTFTPEAGLTTPKTSTIKYTITDTNGQTSNQATITVNAIPLPVTLTVFKVTKEGKIARLNWETTEETNSDHFEIQHSISGKDWNKIGTVDSHGDSKVRNVYSFTDVNPATGENLYRLKMIDRDATFAYSRIQSVKFDGLGAPAVSIYPNPSADRVFVQDMDLAQVKQVSILDMNGRALFSSNKVTADGINVSKFTPGTYILHIKNVNGTVSNHKIVIAK